MARSYRFEVAVKRIFELTSTLATARLRFSVILASFPEIIVQPQLSGGGGVSSPSGDGQRIASLTYNVCHKAEFQLEDDECRSLFPAQCDCTLTDETHASDLTSTLKWTVPCPLCTQDSQRVYGTYSMVVSSTGQSGGCVSMSCRVVALEPARLSLPMSSQPPTTAAMATTTTAGAGAANIHGIKGEPQHPHQQHSLSLHRSPSTSHRPPTGASMTGVGRFAGGNSENSGQIVAQGLIGGKPYVLRVVSDQAVDASRSCHKRGDSPTSVMSFEKPYVAKANTFLYLLQYDVSYQLQSSCEVLAATLKREFRKLNKVALDKRAETIVARATTTVRSISKLSNIILQVVNQLLCESEERKRPNELQKSVEETAAQAMQHRHKKNALPVPRKGSVAYYLMYDVLFQLQCLGVSIAYIITQYRDALEMSVHQLRTQHLTFVRHLCLDVQELTRCINIIVQSTVDGTMGSERGFSKLKTTPERCKRKGENETDKGRQRAGKTHRRRSSADSRVRSVSASSGAPSSSRLSSMYSSTTSATRSSSSSQSSRTHSSSPKKANSRTTKTKKNLSSASGYSYGSALGSFSIPSFHSEAASAPEKGGTSATSAAPAATTVDDANHNSSRHQDSVAQINKAEPAQAFTAQEVPPTVPKTVPAEPQLDVMAALRPKTAIPGLPSPSSMMNGTTAFATMADPNTALLGGGVKPVAMDPGVLQYYQHQSHLRPQVHHHLHAQYMMGAHAESGMRGSPLSSMHMYTPPFHGGGLGRAQQIMPMQPRSYLQPPSVLTPHSIPTPQSIPTLQGVPPPPLPQPTAGMNSGAVRTGGGTPGLPIPVPVPIPRAS